ncbi:MAG: hypothetical protein ACNA8W_10475 [Bradymonadaceae bacterium]
MSRPHSVTLSKPYEDYLARRTKAELTDIVRQLVGGMWMGSKMLDEAILRAHQNTLHDRWKAFEKEERQAMDRRDYNRFPALSDKVDQAFDKAMAAYDLRPGFHIKEGK